MQQSQSWPEISLREVTKIQLQGYQSGSYVTQVWHFSRRWLPAVEKELVKTQQALDTGFFSLPWSSQCWHLTLEAMEKEIQDCFIPMEFSRSLEDLKLDD